MSKYSLLNLKRLRKRAQRAAELPARPLPEGWSVAPVDPMSVLSVFRAIRIKPGYVLRAYQYHCSGNGNARVFAMPVGAPLPPPEECPCDESAFLSPPVPPGAIRKVMEVIEGTGTDWSYLAASLFVRELHELGAMWHGASWGVHTLIDQPSEESESWDWEDPAPATWEPEVERSGGEIQVTFFSFSPVGEMAICRHHDVYKAGSYAGRLSDRRIATGPPGIIF